MSTYVIGDLQGCYSALTQLLDVIRWTPGKDRLVFVGDLVNRGLGSLETLRFIKQLGPDAGIVLGNHDLFLLAAAHGYAKINPSDTIQPVLDAPDRDELLDWLRQQPLAREESGYLIVHAGLMPAWDKKTALKLSREVEKELQGKRWKKFLSQLWGNKPGHWDDRLEGIDRLRVIVNAMTRLRFINASGDIDFKYKGEIDGAPAGLTPWFEVPNRKSATERLIFGHWSALGLRQTDYLQALDTGCVWGGQLTALRLEDLQIFQVDCKDLPDALAIDTSL
ncbi:symmetrical bis(5'-nucleosyl)-tetraphosphatase [Leeia oryzae]|uniref:symmetrical bis(5'-nucleosyl)-tetraphosphatase n=1 Tax=Leeia oryzae TaxID=356662 RepID=UPI00037A1A99|nr:symmetrical bis(5'-nucleosyl)-tetraphosphatase [Leeia oryzae]